MSVFFISLSVTVATVTYTATALQVRSDSPRTSQAGAVARDSHPLCPAEAAILALSLLRLPRLAHEQPREAAPSMCARVSILPARVPATRDAHALRAHTGVALRPSSPP